MANMGLPGLSNRTRRAGFLNRELQVPNLRGCQVTPQPHISTVERDVFFNGYSSGAMSVRTLLTSDRCFTSG
mgnify:CR=1 FL=1